MCRPGFAPLNPGYACFHPRHGLAIGVVGDRLYSVSGDGQSAASGIARWAVGFNEALQLDLAVK